MTLSQVIPLQSFLFTEILQVSDECNYMYLYMMEEVERPRMMHN